jgi:nitric oxide reductase large subunit
MVALLGRLWVLWPALWVFGGDGTWLFPYTAQHFVKPLAMLVGVWAVLLLWRFSRPTPPVPRRTKIVVSMILIATLASVGANLRLAYITATATFITDDDLIEVPTTGRVTDSQEMTK